MVDKINALIVIKMVICQKIAQNQKKKEVVVINAITVKKMVICLEIVLNQKILHDRVMHLLIKLFHFNFPDLDYVFQVTKEK